MMKAWEGYVLSHCVLLSLGQVNLPAFLFLGGKVNCWSTLLFVYHFRYRGRGAAFWRELLKNNGKVDSKRTNLEW